MRLAKTLKSKGLIEESAGFLCAGKAFQLQWQTETRDLSYSVLLIHRQESWESLQEMQRAGRELLRDRRRKNAHVY